MDKLVQIQLTGDVKAVLPVKPDAAVATIYSATDVRDISQKTGNTTREIMFEDTDEVHNIIGHYFDVNVVDGSISPKKKCPCLLLEDGVAIMDNSVLQLTRAVKQWDNTNQIQRSYYVAVVKDQTAALFTTLGTSELEEIPMADLDHLYTSANVVASFSNTQADGYKYAMGLSEGNVFNLSDFRPAIYAKTYFDRIMARAGFSYQWDEMSEPHVRFDKMIVPYNGEVPKRREEETEAYKVEANKTVSQTINGAGSAGTVQSVTPVQVTIPNETADPAGSYNPGTSVYTSPLYFTGGGNISFSLVVEWEAVLDNTSGSTAYLVANNVNDPGARFKPSMYMGVNAGLTNAGYSLLYTGNVMGEITKAGGYNIPSGTTVIGSGTTEVNFAAALATNTSTYRMSSGMSTGFASAYRWRSTSATSGSLVAVQSRMVIKTVTMVIKPSMSEIGYGQRIYMQDFVPRKVKQSDFIKSIFTLCNVMVEPDQFNSSKLIIKSRDKYYDEGKQKDWTKKLDTKKSQDIIFLPNLTCKKLILTYKDDKDEPNTSYTAATSETYGQLEYTMDSEHVKEIDTKEIIFSPTPVTTNDIGAVVPMITGAAPKTNIRLLYDGGEFACNSYTIVDYVNSSGTNVGTTATTYPLLSHFDRPFNPSFDMGFGTPIYTYYDYGAKTNNTAFNRNWRRTLSQYNNGDMYVAYFWLNAADAADLRLSDKICVDNAWYCINRVEYDANSTASTKVELLTADEYLDFLPFKSVKPVKPSLGDVILAPIRTVVGNAVNSVNVVLTKGKVWLSGANNVVGQSVKGAFISGNGNVVGTTRAVVIGDNQVADEDGVYTPMVKFPDGTKMASTADVVSTNFFTGDQLQDANRVHQSAGFNVAVKSTSGWAINDDVLAGTMFRVYNPSGDGVNVYVNGVNGRGLTAQSDGVNGYGFVAAAGGFGGIGIRGYGYSYGGWLNSNQGNGTYGALLEGSNGSGSVFLEGYVFGRVQTLPPASKPSFEWQGYGTSNANVLLVVKNGSGADAMKVQGDCVVRFETGIYVPGNTDVNEVRSVFFPATKSTYGSSIVHQSRGEFGVAYTSHVFDTANALTTAGCKVFEFRNNGTVLFGMDKDGAIYANGLPTSSAGLAAGYLFKDDNGDGTSTIKIVN